MALRVVSVPQAGFPKNVLVAIREVWDLAAAVQEPTDPDLWRVNGGAWTSDGVHPSLLGHTSTAASILATSAFR